MKTYQIIKVNTVTKEIEKIKDFQGSTKKLCSVLWDLQKAENTKVIPGISKEIVQSKEGNILSWVAKSINCNFIHIAPIKLV